MKTIQFNANQILNRNNYPIASNMVIISTGPILLSMTLWVTQNISYLS